MNRTRTIHVISDSQFEAFRFKSPDIRGKTPLETVPKPHQFCLEMKPWHSQSQSGVMNLPRINGTTLQCDPRGDLQFGTVGLYCRPDCRAVITNQRKTKMFQRHASHPFRFQLHSRKDTPMLFSQHEVLAGGGEDGGHDFSQFGSRRVWGAFLFNANNPCSPHRAQWQVVRALAKHNSALCTSRFRNFRGTFREPVGIVKSDSRILRF